MTDVPGWVLDVLACPADRGRLVGGDDGFTCEHCGARYPATGGIPRILPAGLQSSAKAQQDVYDARNAQISAGAQEAGFALQLIYRRRLVLATLRALDIPVPSDGSLWTYVGGGEGTQCFVLSEFGGRHVSLDVSASQLELGRWLALAVVPRYLPRAKPEQVAFVQGDAEAPFPLRDGCSSVVYGLGVLNHLPPSTWVHHLRRLRDLAAPGGVVFHVVPNLHCEVYRSALFTEQFANPASMQYWTQFVDADAVTSAFSAAGLQSIQTATLWRLNHDAVVRGIYRVDRLLARATAGWWRYHASRAVQAVAFAAAERQVLPGRRWQFAVPKHLAVVGRRPAE